MARYYFQGTCRDGMGRSVPSATIAVFLATTTTVAKIYAASAGGSAIAGGVITADATGYFGFWVDTGDYANTQFFKVVCSAPNYQYPIAGITWDNIAILH